MNDVKRSGLHNFGSQPVNKNTGLSDRTPPANPKNVANENMESYTGLISPETKEQLSKALQEWVITPAANAGEVLVSSVSQGQEMAIDFLREKSELFNSAYNLAGPDMVSYLSYGCVLTSIAAPVLWTWRCASKNKAMQVHIEAFKNETLAKAHQMYRDFGKAAFDAELDRAIAGLNEDISECTESSGYIRGCFSLIGKTVKYAGLFALPLAVSPQVGAGIAVGSAVSGLALWTFGNFWNRSYDNKIVAQLKETKAILEAEKEATKQYDEKKAAVVVERDGLNDRITAKQREVDEQARLVANQAATHDQDLQQLQAASDRLKADHNQAIQQLQDESAQATRQLQGQLAQANTASAEERAVHAQAMQNVQNQLDQAARQAQEREAVHAQAVNELQRQLREQAEQIATLRGIQAFLNAQVATQVTAAMEQMTGAFTDQLLARLQPAAAAVEPAAVVQDNQN